MELEELYTPPNYPIFYDPVVKGLDIFIFIIILVFTLFNVPRYLLRRGSATESRTDRPISAATSQNKEHVLLRYSSPILESAGTLNKQWHFPIHLSLRHPAAGFMHYRVLGNYTVVQVLLMAGYTVALLYAVFYVANPFSNPIPAGSTIGSQMPFVYAFATKNNIIALLVGVGYEKLNYLHRHVGLLMVIGANVHAIGFIYKWTMMGIFSDVVADVLFVRWGFVALVCFDLLGFFSIQCVRTKFYNLFFVTHAVGLTVSLFALGYHQPTYLPYAIAASVFYGIDHVVRVIKTRIATATLRTIPEMGLTRVDIPSLRTGWRAGQHVRLRVLSTAMGLWGMTEVHPFTIANATNTEDGLILMCKGTGHWTNKLYEMAQTTASNGQGQVSVRKVKVMVEGPYGGIGDTTVANYSGAMFVVGGSGVAFALSAVQDLVMDSDRSRIKVIEVIWIIKDPAVLEHFIPLFASLASQSSPAGVRVSVFYTRATTFSLKGLLLPPGITLTPGRPHIKELLDGFVVTMMSRGGTHGAFVGICGPVGLGKDVAHAVWNYNAESKEAIGGFQFHEEVFGW